MHSRYSMHAADTWYGAGFAKDWARIPHLRALPAREDKLAARRELGLAPDDFLVCTFGHIGPTKLNHRLLQAWNASSLARDPRCKLVLVGNPTAPLYGEQILQLARQAKPGQVSITGYASRALYERHLAAADLAVQLRTLSRGETSGAALDCLGHGLPLVANANGSNAEFPPEAVCLLPDLFTDEQLVAALERLRSDDAQRARFSEGGRAHVAAFHDPVAIAQQYRNAIEAFATRPQHAPYWNAVAAIGAIGRAQEHDLQAAAVALEATWQRSPA